MKLLFRHSSLILLAGLLCNPILSGCKKDIPNSQNHLPKASFYASPDRVEVNTLVNFDADSVSDAEDANAVLKVRWDFENDNIYDTELSTSKTTSHTYSALGVYLPKLEVLDTGGMTDTVKRMVVVVSDLSNLPPDMPVYITPPNWQTWMEPTIIFQWTCTDPENDSLSFDILIGQNVNTLNLAESDITNFVLIDNVVTFTTTLSSFKFNQDYYWQIAAKDIVGNYTPGRIWKFTTRPE